MVPVPYGSVTFLQGLLSVTPISPREFFVVFGLVSVIFCESFRRLLRREPVPFGVIFPPFAAPALGGCLNPDGGRFELSEGEGDDCEGAPLMDVCNAGGGGRFTLEGIPAGLAETAVAISGC